MGWGGGGETGQRKSWPKKSKTSFRFFSTAIFVLTIPSPITNNHRRTLEFVILNHRQTFLGIYSLQYQIWGLHNYDWWEGVMKIAAEKMANVGKALKKYLKCGQNKSSGLLVRHQAARPSCSIDLAGRLTVWIRFYVITSEQLNHLINLFITFTHGKVCRHQVLNIIAQYVWKIMS